MSEPLSAAVVRAWRKENADALAEVHRLRTELARRDEQIAAAWDEGEGAGWGRANRKWSDEPDLQRATNPYRGGAS